jgi:hypothetical protein
MPLNNSLFSFLELCLVAVMPVAVACVIDAMVCICVCSFVHGVWKFRMGAKVFMSSSAECAPNFSCF